MGAKNANAKGSKFRDRSHCDCVHLLNTGIEVDHRLCSSTVCVWWGGLWVFACGLENLFFLSWGKVSDATRGHSHPASHPSI